jgi:hypothetical protein
MPEARAAVKAPPTATLADRVMKARRDSACAACERPIRRGQQIARIGQRWVHIEHVLEWIRSQRDELAAQEAAG